MVVHYSPTTGRQQGTLRCGPDSWIGVDASFASSAGEEPARKQLNTAAQLKAVSREDSGVGLLIGTGEALHGLFRSSRVLRQKANTPPVKGGGSSCHRTRVELDKLLRESKYGDKTRVFDAYFTWSSKKEGGGGLVPLCIECGLTIGCHVLPGGPASGVIVPVLSFDDVVKEFNGQMKEPEFEVESLAVNKKLIERDSVLTKHAQYIAHLLDTSTTQSSAFADSGRSVFPLEAVIGCPGSGKTLAMKVIARHHLTQGDLVSMISFGNGTPLSGTDRWSVSDEIVLRIFFSFAGASLMTWVDFEQRVKSNFQLPMIKDAIEMIRVYFPNIAPAANSTSCPRPFVLLIDETAKWDDGAVLSFAGALQQSQLENWRMGVNGSSRVHVIVSSLRQDFLEKETTESGRDIWLVNCPLFSSAALFALKVELERHLETTRVAVTPAQRTAFVAKQLFYTGGLPRAVRIAETNIKRTSGVRDGDSERLQSYKAPPWALVKQCLLGKPYETSSAAARASIGHAVTMRGLIPTLPPFQVQQWVTSVITHSASSIGEEGKVSRWFTDIFSMTPPSTPSEASNHGGQRCSFEQFTQVFELVQSQHKQPRSLEDIFSSDGFVASSDLDTTTMTIRWEASEVSTSGVWNFPASLYDVGNESKLKAYEEGKLLVVPQNPNNFGLDYGSRVMVSIDGKEEERVDLGSQDKLKKFRSEASLLEEAQTKMGKVHYARDDVFASKGATTGDLATWVETPDGKKVNKTMARLGQSLVAPRLNIIYTMMEPQDTKNLTLQPRTIVVTRAGCEHMLGGIGRSALLL